MDPRCHIDTCVWYPNKNVDFGILRAIPFSMGRFLREGLGVRLKLDRNALMWLTDFDRALLFLTGVSY